ncbi:hypothetical protein FF1_007686 [Malus domestica]
MEGCHLPIVPSDGSRDGSRFVDNAMMVTNKATVTNAHQQPPRTFVQVVADFLKVQTTATLHLCPTCRYNAAEHHHFTQTPTATVISPSSSLTLLLLRFRSAVQS